MKLRPVLLLTDPIGPVPEILVAYISCVFPPTLLASDLVLDPNIPDHVVTRLKTTSVVRLHKLATIHGRNVVRRVGQVSPTIWGEVATRLRTLLAL